MTPSSPSDMGAEDTNPDSPDVGLDNLDSDADPLRPSTDHSTPSQPTPRQTGTRRSSVSGQEESQPSTSRGWKRKKSGERTRDDVHKVTEQFVKSIAEDRVARRQEHTEDRMTRREEHSELLTFNRTKHEETLAAQTTAQAEATRSARQTGVDVATALSFIADSIGYLAEGVHRSSGGS